MELETQVDGVGDEVSQASETIEPTANENDNRQPEQAEKPKVNLDELDEFRTWKSNADKKIAEAERRAMAAEQERLRLKAEADKARMSTMTDEDRLRYQLEQMSGELQTYRAQASDAQLRADKEQQINQIVEKTGVPREAILEAATPGEAWAIAVDYFKTNTSTSQRKARRQEVVESNSTDVGGGVAPPVKDVRAKVRQAIEDNDMAAIYNAYVNS